MESINVAVWWVESTLPLACLISPHHWNPDSYITILEVCVCVKVFLDVCVHLKLPLSFHKTFRVQTQPCSQVWVLWLVCECGAELISSCWCECVCGLLVILSSSGHLFPAAFTGSAPRYWHKKQEELQVSKRFNQIMLKTRGLGCSVLEERQTEKRHVDVFPGLVVFWPR